MWEEILASYMGKPIAIWCIRYTYRGIVKAVNSEVVTLAQPKAVEVSGPSNADKPKQEDPIPSDLHISLSSIEIACQPKWVWDGFSK